MKNYLIFGNFDSRNYNAIVRSTDVYDSPEKNAEIFTIPGRNGNLIVEDGTYKNVPKTYTCIFHNLEFPEVVLSELKSYFIGVSGYQELEDSYNPEHFRLARFVSPLSIEKKTDSASTFIVKLAFDCKAQKFLLSGKEVIENPDTIRNPTGFDARPILQFTASATQGGIVFGNSEIYFDGATVGERFIIDGENLDVVNSDHANRNNIFTMNDCYIKPGGSIVSTSGLSEYSFIPRWWTL